MINWHCLILDGKSIEDDALTDLYELEDLIPDRLKEEFEKIMNKFNKTLSECKYDRFTDDADVVGEAFNSATKRDFERFVRQLDLTQKNILIKVLQEGV